MVIAETQPPPRRFTLTQLAQLSGLLRENLAGMGRNRWFPVAGVAHGEPLFNERSAMAVCIAAIVRRYGGSFIAIRRATQLCLRDDVPPARFIRVRRHDVEPCDDETRDQRDGDTLAVLDRQKLAERFRAVTSGDQPGGEQDGQS